VAAQHRLLLYPSSVLFDDDDTQQGDDSQDERGHCEKGGQGLGAYMGYILDISAKFGPLAKVLF